MPRSLDKALKRGRRAARLNEAFGRPRTCARLLPPISAISDAKSAQVAAPQFARCRTYVGEIVTSSAATKWLPLDKDRNTACTKLNSSHGPKKALVRMISAS